MIFTRSRKRPKYEIGEIVRVKTRDEILKSMDSTNKLDGCFFMDQMWNYCGSTQKVLKFVDSFFNERQKKSFLSRSPLYILENLHCEGKASIFPSRCDHGCLLLWHEKWLDKT
jgi:hypothetical protein